LLERAGAFSLNQGVLPLTFIFSNILFYFMVKYNYKKLTFPPLTPKEIEEKLKETQDEMKVVFKWKKENEAKKPKDKRALSWKTREANKIQKRIDSVNGMLMYWKLRVEGKSHFYASIELNEYWAKLNGTQEEVSED